MLQIACPDSSFDELLKNVEMNHQLPCDPDSDGCGKMNYVHHFLSNVPHVFTTGFSCFSTIGLDYLLCDANVHFVEYLNRGCSSWLATYSWTFRGYISNTCCYHNQDGRWCLVSWHWSWTSSFACVRGMFTSDLLLIAISFSLLKTWT